MNRFTNIFRVEHYTQNPIFAGFLEILSILKCLIINTMKTSKRNAGKVFEGTYLYTPLLYWVTEIVTLRFFTQIFTFKPNFAPGSIEPLFGLSPR